MKRNNLVGQKFGRLTVISFHGMENRNSTWLCKCSCGNEIVVYGCHLKSGLTKSCGCYNSECIGGRRRTHGLTGTRLFNIWKGMKTRCFNPNSQAYKNYGGRGITICDEWKSDFQHFHDWAILHGYSDSLTIDRINNDGNYEPSNCRWATRKQQNSNRRNTPHARSHAYDTA